MISEFSYDFQKLSKMNMSSIARLNPNNVEEMLSPTVVLKNDPNQIKFVNSLFDLGFGVENDLDLEKKIVDLSESVIEVVEDRLKLRTIPLKGGGNDTDTTSELEAKGDLAEKGDLSEKVDGCEKNDECEKSCEKESGCDWLQMIASHCSLLFVDVNEYANHFRIRLDLMCYDWVRTVSTPKNYL